MRIQATSNRTGQVQEEGQVAWFGDGQPGGTWLLNLQRTKGLQLQPNQVLVRR